MSGATHVQSPVRQQLLREQRRARIIALAAVTVVTAGLVALVLALNGGDQPARDTNSSSLQAEQPSIPQTQEPGVRYDGGPEEGTAALTQRSAPATFDPNSIKEAPGVRYDGGPEEGTRGVTTSESVPDARYDGGPEEGSRGIGH